MKFNHQDKYRQSYNAGPMRFLPLAYNPKQATNCKKPTI